jgi:hypothetical protein
MTATWGTSLALLAAKGGQVPTHLDLASVLSYMLIGLVVGWWHG